MEPSQISYMYIIFPLWGTAKIIITTIRLRFHRLLLAVMMLMDDDDDDDDVDQHYLIQDGYNSQSTRFAMMDSDIQDLV